MKIKVESVLNCEVKQLMGKNHRITQCVEFIEAEPS